MINRSVDGTVTMAKPFTMLRFKYLYVVTSSIARGVIRIYRVYLVRCNFTLVVVLWCGVMALAWDAVSYSVELLLLLLHRHYGCLPTLDCSLASLCNFKPLTDTST